ncbi:MAG: vanadium-dependent haloperoxidase [Rhodobacteraceae bacterium]|nr:vanadium-dependent haloperoxidase [Paracoccaceae bacterium]
MHRRRVLGLGAAAVAVAFLPRRALAASDPGAVLTTWYRLVLELVRHTATYSPPVASRAFAYLGVAAWEAVASDRGDTVSLAGQLAGLPPLPACDPGLTYNPAAILNATLSRAVAAFFGNTGPTGQRAMQAMARQMGKGLTGLPADVLARSEALGHAIADHIIAWSLTDGGAVVENMGFPMDYTLTDGPAHWVPTSLIRQQQTPLLPGWANNRPFAMPAGNSCALPPPPAYSEEVGSAFHAEAMEVYTTSARLTEDQKTIARFWSDDPMLSPTPPGHWVDIVLQISDRDGLDALRSADILARLGVAMADAFIGCWEAKFAHDLLRPVTYIHRVIDPNWEPLLITPPFPEYPSGHSTLSGAAATVLTASLGADFAFDDATHEADGLAARPFPSFWAAAQEAAISRLYGGIHFRAAVERGLDQGACIGAHAVRLRTLV